MYRPRVLHKVINQLNSTKIGVRFIQTQIYSLNHSIEPTQTTVDAKELQNLASHANKWWDLSGPLKALHSMNTVRVPFIREGLIATNKVNPANIQTNKVLEGVKILDIGCGGGILTESLARLHGSVTAIDPGNELLQVAIDHSSKDPMLNSFLDYRNETVEDHIKENEGKYDAVIVSEVIEHIVNKEMFLEVCCKAVNKNGSIFITTLNRSTISWLGAIIVAENLLNLVPKQTHDWDKFIQPIEIQRILENNGMTTVLVNGMAYDFWRNAWRTVSNTEINYGLQAVKY